MRHKERKRELSTGTLSGLLVTLISFACLVLLFTALVKSGRLRESLLHLLLPLGCLASSAAGVFVQAGKKEARPYSRLLCGAVPFVCLLCCGLAFARSGSRSTLLWNGFAFLIPSLAAMIPGGRKSHRRR